MTTSLLHDAVTHVDGLPVANDTPEAQPSSTLLQHMWYHALHSSELGRGKMLTKTICEEMILFGRKKDGTAFAISNICPHQGMPLHCGWFDGEQVACRFHAWKFDETGQCTHVPSFTDAQQPLAQNYRVKEYPVREHLDGIWVYIGDATNPQDLPTMPTPLGITGTEKYIDKVQHSFLLPSHIDIGVIGLMDPAHVPFVHTSWWYSSPKRIYDKTKHFEPYHTGYTMRAHEPSKNAMLYQWFGAGMHTEICMILPGIRMEHVKLGNQTLFSFFTTLTPINETQTELKNTLYWTHPAVSLGKPLINYLVKTFLQQDVDISYMQQQVLSNKPKNFPQRLIQNVPDAGYPVVWYHRCKREWATAHREAREFVNPLKPQTLQWRT